MYLSGYVSRFLLNSKLDIEVISKSPIISKQYYINIAVTPAGIYTMIIKIF
jgi:hypothetical protein